MRTIGLLGGMSWESSIEYYRFINEITRERLGHSHSATSVMLSFDFAEIEALQEQQQWDEAGARLASAARTVEAAGADVLVICTNTMHRVAEQVEAAVSIPLIHIADATATRIKSSGLGRVGLLATRYTMEGQFYVDRLEVEHGLEVIVPDEHDRIAIHDIIYTELVRGVVRSESRQRYRAVIEALIARGAEGILFGCTEIELLVHQRDSGVPIFDTTYIHAEAAVELALADDRQSRPARGSEG